MRSILKFDKGNALRLPEELQGEDVRFSDSFAEYFIEHFSNPGDTVLDPFAGFGTVLYAAERLNRRAAGVELLPGRAGFIRINLKEPGGVFTGSALDIDSMDIPNIDLVLTSPPYMQSTGHPEYPFAGYRVTGQGYGDYLKDIAGIFGQVSKRLRPGGRAVIEASNLSIDGRFTPLAWDIARAVGGVMDFEREIVIEWEGGGASPAYGFGYDHSYALIFLARP